MCVPRRLVLPLLAVITLALATSGQPATKVVYGSGDGVPVDTDCEEEYPQLYNPRLVSRKYLHPDRLKDSPETGSFVNVTEVAPQIYMFNLFTPEYCALLIKEVEACGDWETKTTEFVQDHSFDDAQVEAVPPEKTIDLDQMPGLDTAYYRIAEKHILPLVASIWKSFVIRKFDDPYVLKYEMTSITKMRLHHDAETVTLIVYLNDGYEGGGTHFPRYNYTSGRPPPGTAVLYPGRLSHEHAGLPITRGRRYLLLSSFY